MSTRFSGDPGGSRPDAMLTETAQVAHMNPEPTEHSADYSPSLLPNESSRTDRPANNKRKSPDSAYKNETIPKRVRVEDEKPRGSRVAPSSVADRAKQLPAEIWQHIFTFVPPRALGRLLLVSRLFYVFLHPSPTVGVFAHSPTSCTTLKPLKPNAIWQASRRLFWPRMPTPLKGRSELDMWRLVCSFSCQFCLFKSNNRGLDADNLRHRGPGAKGVCPIFPFSVFVCGSCLSSKSVKEIDVLLSSAVPSLLLPALPMVFVTDEQHIIPPSVMQSETLPSQLHVTKVYWSDHLDQIKAEFETVKLLGSAAAEEWIKGLENRGKAALADASRWEKWDSAGGVHQMQRSLHSSSPTLETTKVVKHLPSFSQSQGHVLENLLPNPGCGERPRPVPEQTGNSSVSIKADVNNEQPRLLTQQKRTKEEVAELKVKRRAEIERRALLLDPPLVSGVLAHIPSFQAALQIITPLDENAWDLLKPRLLAQREEAESRERERNTNARALQEKAGVKKQTTETPKGLRTVTDKDWDEIQGPLRGRISSFADEIIRDGWNNGEKVRKKSSPQFAAEVLLYVRKRFYAEVAKDAAAAVTAGLEPTLDPSEGPWTQKLTLENMKWVFDLKVKPHTEPYRKELFLCNACSGNSKFYGFEGVIQHYASKHTTALSVGNVVVYWRAEWPEIPPFNPDPRHPDVHRTNQAPIVSNSSRGINPNPGYPAYSHGPPPTEYPGYSYGAPVPPRQFDPEPHASFPAAHHGSNVPAYGAHPPSSYYSQYVPDGGYSPYPPGPPYGNSNFSHGLPNNYGGSFNPVSHEYHYTSYPNPQESCPSQASGTSYKDRLNIMTKVAKEAWNKISGIKNLPISVKICVVVHCIAKTFQNDFAESAPLAMFIDALSNCKEMRPIRNTNGLTCKACTISNRTPERTNFSLPQLVNHFSRHHTEGPGSQGARPIDWRIDMVLLPNMSVLQNLRKVLENHRPAYGLVADTLPWAFDEPSNNISESQPWPSASDLAIGRSRRESNYPLERINSYDTSKYQPDVAKPRQHRQLAEDLHHDSPKHDIGHNPSRSPSYSPAPANTVPTLRPASEVYAPAKRKRGAEQMQSRLPPHASTQHVASLRDHPGPDSTDHDTLSREQREPLPSYKPESHEPLRSTQSHQGSHVQQGHRDDYRNIEPIPHVSTDDPPQAYKANVSRGERWKTEMGQFQRSSVPPPPKAPVPQPADDDFGLLDALESHLQREHEEIIYVDTSGRELGRATRPVGMRPTPHRTMYHNDLGSEMQRPPPPSELDAYDSVGHHSRAVVSRYASHSYHREAERAPHNVYHDDTRLPPGRPVETYELIEVRDQQGNYFVRRPVQRHEGEHYAYERRLVRRNSRPYLSYEPIDNHPPTRPVAYVTDGRTAPPTPTRQTAIIEYENYEPRHAVSGQREHLVRQDRR